MNLSVVIPVGLVPSHVQDIKKWVVEVAVEAAKAGLIPEIPDKAGENHNLKMYIGSSVLASMPRVADMPMAQVVAGLVNAWSKRERASARNAVAAGAMKAENGSGKGLRPEQVRLIDSVEVASSNNGIVFAEAGTGVGKTLAGLTMAARYADKTGRPAVIAVPTVAVLGQVVDEYKSTEAGVMGLTRKPALAFLLGRGNFVSPQLLRDFIANPGELAVETVEKARIWLECGGKGGEGAKTAHLHSAVPDLAWLVEDLQHAAPGFPAEEVRLSEKSTEDCPAQAIYNRFRLSAMTSEIIVCTHAMLGLNTMISARTAEEVAKRIEDLEHKASSARAAGREKAARSHDQRLQQAINQLAEIEAQDEEERIASSPILPDYGFLVIDEAHQFEASIASLRTSDLNPRMLAKEIESKMEVFAACRKKGTAEQIAGILEQLHNRLVQVGLDKTYRREERVRLNGADADNNASKAVMEFFFKLKEMKPREIIRACRSAKPMLEPLAVIIRNMTENGEGVWASFSPRRKYPSLHSGPSTVRPVLERIWDRVDSAVLLSATLALPDSAGVPKVSYLASTLAVPSMRMKTITPIVQPWLFEPLLHETAKGRKDMKPPKEMSDETGIVKVEEAKVWANAIATELAKIAQDARGGTLALTSSYERIGLIEKALEAIGTVEKARFVVQKRATGVRLAQAEFEQKARAGLRPIWLAAGGAWTGLDISDKRFEPAEDFMLTDLAIINIPFGTNLSTTHKARQEWMNTAERDRAALEFKQGIGRLMRRGGLLDRRLHILDPRIWDKSVYYAPFRRMLAGYKVAE